MNDTIRGKIIIDEQIYDNPKLRERISRLPKWSQNIAWNIVNILKKISPKWNEKLRGKLVAQYHSEGEL